jgi:hypothetical protein
LPFGASALGLEMFFELRFTKLEESDFLFRVKMWPRQLLWPRGAMARSVYFETEDGGFESSQGIFGY